MGSAGAGGVREAWRRRRGAGWFWTLGQPPILMPSLDPSHNTNSFAQPQPQSPYGARHGASGVTAIHPLPWDPLMVFIFPNWANT